MRSALAVKPIREFGDLNTRNFGRLPILRKVRGRLGKGNQEYRNLSWVVQPPSEQD